MSPYLDTAFQFDKTQDFSARPHAIFSTIQGTQNPSTKHNLQRAKNADTQPTHHPVERILIGLTLQHQPITFINNPQFVNNF